MRAQLLLSVGRIHNSNVFKTTIQIDFNPLGRCLLAIDSVLALLFMSDPNKTRVFAACSQSPGIVICLIYAPMHRSQCSDPGLVLAIMEQFITRTSCDMLNFFLFSCSNSPIKGIKVFILFEKVTVNHGLFWGNKTLSNIKIKLETSAPPQYKSWRAVFVPNCFTTPSIHVAHKMVRVKFSKQPSNERNLILRLCSLLSGPWSASVIARAPDDAKE